jgi:hypothetical protein
MALTTEQYNRLMRFLDAALSPEELAAFENELDANPELRQQLNFELGVAGALAGKEEGVSPAETGKVVSLTNHRWKYWVAAASVVVVTVAAYFFFRPGVPQQPLVDRPDSTQTSGKDSARHLLLPPTTRAVNTDSLFKQFYKKPATPEDAPMILADAFSDYEKGRYGAIASFDIDHLPTLRGGDNEKDSIRSLAIFYKGIAALEQYHFEHAIHWFTEKLTPNGMWYLAMTYLKMGDVKGTITILKKLQGDQTYGAKATQLLKALQ